MLRDETHARLGARAAFGVDPAENKLLAQNVLFTSV